MCIAQIGLSMRYKLVDLFAGPGGLSEGFSRILTERGSGLFDKTIAVESNGVAHRTLTLRSFLRRARVQGDRTALDLYWSYLADPTSERLSILQQHRAWRDALIENGGRPLTLGVESDDQWVEGTLKEAKLSDHVPWVLIGGPPCQAYSLVGRARMRSRDPVAFYKDRRHVLYREYLRIIRLFSPAIFVMENVKGLISSRLDGEPIFGRIVDDLRRGGEDRNRDDVYAIRSLTVPAETLKPSQFVVQSEFYGIPQARHRVFIIGVHKTLARAVATWSRYLLEPSTPTATSQIAAIDVIGDLPEVRARSSTSSSGANTERETRAEFARAIRAARNDTVTRTAKANRRAAAAMASALRSKASGHSKIQRRRHNQSLSALVASYGTRQVLDHLGQVPNHDARLHMPADLARYLYASSWAKANGTSPRLADYPKTLLPKHANVQAGVREAVFADRFRVQVADRPATTITSHISKDGHYFIHPDPTQHRSLTVREAARLQTFPDDYFFEGARTAQYHQVGNAVPPFLAAQIAEIVRAILDAG